MFSQLPSLQRLINQLRTVPYLASKNIYRVALHFLESSPHDIDAFCRAVTEAKKHIRACSSCFNWTEQQELCPICSNQRREQRLICVVETWPDLFAIERIGEYKGVYHVLGGVLSPLEGVGPEDLHINQLTARIDSLVAKEDDHDQPIELIFATSPTPEGEATISYITTQLTTYTATGILRCSRLASGLPTGATLSYMDRITLHKALAGRTPVS